jgi:hypothetical protein
LFVTFHAFCGFTTFPSSRWSSWAFCGFWSSSCASCVLDSNFKLCAFVLSMYSSRGRLRNQVLSTLVWLWWVIDLPQFEFKSGKFQWFYPITLLSCVENHVFLSHGVQLTGATWWATTRIAVGVGERVQRTGDGHTSQVLSAWMIERSGDVVWGLHCAQGDKECEFLSLATKPRSMICQWFDLKTTRTVSSGLVSKPVATGFPVWTSKLAATVWWFGLKIITTISWFGPQNQASYGLSVVPQNLQSMKTARGMHQDLAACFAWKQVGLEFSSLTSRGVEARCGWCTWHHRECYVEVKRKTVGSMASGAAQRKSDQTTLILS